MTYEEHVKHEKYLAREEGLKDGREDMRLEIAAKMKARGSADAEIAEVTGLAIEEIEKL